MPLLFPRPSTVNVPALVVGLNILRKLHLYIAYNERKIYFTAAEASIVAESPAPAAKPALKGQ